MRVFGFEFGWPAPKRTEGGVAVNEGCGPVDVRVGDVVNAFGPGPFASVTRTRSPYERYREIAAGKSVELHTNPDVPFPSKK